MALCHPQGFAHGRDRAACPAMGMFTSSAWSPALAFHHETAPDAARQAGRNGRGCQETVRGCCSVAVAIHRLLKLGCRATNRLCKFSNVEIMPLFQTDRQVIERLIVPAMASAIVLIMKQELERDLQGESAELNNAHLLLREAMEEPVKDLPPDRVNKIIRRAKRVAVTVLTSNFDKPLALQYLIIAQWVIDMADREVICIGAESSFAKAWDIMAEILGAIDDKLEEMAEESVAGAAALGNALRTEGYFKEPS